MFHNDSSVLTKYWAEIWWNPQNKTFQGSRCLGEASSSQESYVALRCPPLTHLAAGFSLALLKKVQNAVYFIPPSTPPRQAHYQYSSIPTCIPSEKQNSKSFHAIKSGNLEKWRFLFLLHADSHRKWRERLVKLPSCFADHKLDRERPPWEWGGSGF